MTRGSAQAGNRAGKTARYLQWQENRPEWLAVTSAVDNWHNSTFYWFFDMCGLGSEPRENLVDPPSSHMLVWQNKVSDAVYWL